MVTCSGALGVQLAANSANTRENARKNAGIAEPTPAGRVKPLRLKKLSRDLGTAKYLFCRNKLARENPWAPPSGKIFQ
jgi:hypothetical protein